MFSPIQVDAISKLDRCMHYLVEFCIWIYIYIYICLLVCTHVRDWIYVPSLYVCTYLRMYTHTYVCM